MLEREAGAGGAVLVEGYTVTLWSNFWVPLLLAWRCRHTYMCSVLPLGCIWGLEVL